MIKKNQYGGSSLYYQTMITSLKPWSDGTAARKQEYDNIVSMATANMLFVNDLLCGIIVDLGFDLREDGMMKREVKKYYNMANAARHKYEKTICRCTGDVDMYEYADQQESYYEGVKHELTVAYYSVKNECDRLKLKESRSLARLHQAHLIVRASLEICTVWEERMHAILPDKYAPYTIHNLRMEELYGCIKKLHHAMFTQYIKEFGEKDIPDDAMSADNILLKKLVDMKLIHESASMKTEERVTA